MTIDWACLNNKGRWRVWSRMRVHVLGHVRMVLAVIVRKGSRASNPTLPQTTTFVIRLRRCRLVKVVELGASYGLLKFFPLCRSCRYLKRVWAPKARLLSDGLDELF